MVYFISDVHLGLQDKSKEIEKENKLVDFLDNLPEETSALFILGDLFDYWFEYRTVCQKYFYKTLTALKKLSEAGVKIHYFIGNHDFMHRDFFETEIGVKLYKSPESFELCGKRFYMGHGDGLVGNDLGYNILKMILRNRFFQFLYSCIHPDFGVFLASLVSRKSRKYTSKKNYGEIDGLFNAAKLKIDEGADFVVFGHLHKRMEIPHKNGVYYNLGSWLDFPCFAKFDGNEFKVFDIK